MLSIRRIGAFGKTYRHLNRYRQILAVLIKYGFENLIDRLNIDQYIEIGYRMLTQQKRTPHPSARFDRASRLRMALEELGPTYIKLGQLVSVRTDLLPARFIEELARLQDDVSPLPIADVIQVFQREFQHNPEDLFHAFDPSPMASASIGQVHAAVLRGGERAAVKVQRPGIRRMVEVDIEIMLHLAMLMERNIEEMRLHRPVRIVEEFARVMERELDYSCEADNMERFGRLFGGDPTVSVPRVFREFTSSRILVMEFVEGIKVSQIEQLQSAGLNLKKITRRGADLMLKQVFDHGFFHADPHPGNICVLPRNVICLLDFGMMGNIDTDTRADFVDLIYGVVQSDAARTAQVLLRMTEWERDPDLHVLERDVSDIIGHVVNRPLKDIEITRLLQQMLALTSRHQMRIPPDIFLMMKALSTIEGVARMLYPQFDMASHAAPFIRREKMARFKPDRIAREIGHMGADFLDFVREFPKEVMEIARMVKKQRLTVQFRHRGLERMIEAHDQISNKLSLAIIIAALIIGSSIIVIAKIPPLYHGISLIGIIIFLAAAIMGIWLIIVIARKGKL